MIKKLLLLLLSAHELHAFYNGNPSSPMMPEQGIFSTNTWLGFKTGYAFDKCFDRKLESETHSIGAHDQKSTSEAQMGVLTLVLGNRVEVYTDLGAMRFALSQHVGGHRIHYTTDSGFAWAIGGRTLFSYWGHLQFGLTASYLHSAPDVRSITVSGRSLPKDHARLHYNEWQVGAALVYPIFWLYPYLGATYSHATEEWDDLTSLEVYFPKKNFTLENHRHYGLCVGCGLAPEKAIAVNAEWRF